MIKKITINLITIMLLGITINCKEHSHKHDSDKKNSEHHHGESEKVTLSNGERWQANPETTQGIQKMTSLISEFDDKKSLSQYTALKVAIETEYNQVFQKCTMKGEAHQQLHNYLLPMKEVLNGLLSEDNEKRELSLKRLKLHLSKYSTFFK